MKNLSAVFILLMALFVFSCSDPCKDVVCGPGVCVEGTCICQDGYEGTSCEIESRSLYYQKYLVTTIDCEDGVDYEATSITISERGDGVNDVSVAMEDGSQTLILEGTIINGVLSSSAEVDILTISLNGDFSADYKTLTSDLRLVGFANCNVTFVAE